jgi:hypothetical protein
MWAVQGIKLAKDYLERGKWVDIDDLKRIRRVAIAAAAVAVLIFTSSLLYNLSIAGDWDCEDIGVSSFRSYIASTEDSEGNLHILFVGRAEGVTDSGLIYGQYHGGDIEFEQVTGGWYSYESLSIAVDSEGDVFVTVVAVDNDFRWNGLYAVRKDGQWRSEIVTTPAAPDYMRTYMIGVVIDCNDNPNLFYYQEPGPPQYEPVFVWSTETGGTWDNRTVPVGDLGYRNLYSACCDSSGRVHFTSSVTNSSYWSGKGYSVYDGHTITTIEIPSIGGQVPLALDGEGRARIGVVENSTGTKRFSIASIDGDPWAFDPVANCGEYSTEIPFLLIDDEEGLHTVLFERNPLPDYDTRVVYASSKNGTWTLHQIDLVMLNGPVSSCLTITANGVVTVFYGEYKDRSNIMTKASSEKDIETLMQPYVEATELTLLVTVPLMLTALVVVYASMRVNAKRRRDKDFKKPFDFGESEQSEHSPEKRT